MDKEEATKNSSSCFLFWEMKTMESWKRKWKFLRMIYRCVNESNVGGVFLFMLDAVLKCFCGLGTFSRVPPFSVCYAGV